MTSPSPRPPTDLLADSTPELAAPGRYLWHVPDGWQQGRGAFGGLVLAALLRSIESAEPDRARAVRSLNAELAGPVLPGEATLHVTELRRGNGLSAWSATLVQAGQSAARCSAVLARPRNSDPVRIHQVAPSPPPWRDVPVLPMESAPGVPVFTRHLSFRPMGPFPFSGAPEPLAEGWISPRLPLPSLGAPEIVALADAWWPADLVTLTEPRPMATVAFSLQLFLPEPPLDPQVPLFYRGRVLAEQAGYSAEHRELWTHDGRLVALNQQTIARIR